MDRSIRRRGRKVESTNIVVAKMTHCRQ